MPLVFRQSLALGQLVFRHWARAGLPNAVRKNQGRRASGAIFRAAFVLLIVHWGWRVGTACAAEPASSRPAAVAWLVVGLTLLAVAWGALGRLPMLRGNKSATSSPLLDALPLSESSRLVVGLVERVVAYALAIPALHAAVPAPGAHPVLVAVAIATAGILTGEAILRLLRTVASPMRMARAGSVAFTAQLVATMVALNAPALGRWGVSRRWVVPLLPTFEAFVEGRAGTGVLLGVALGVALGACVVIRIAERIGYDRVDLVPSKKQKPARPRDLTLSRVERVLDAREPGGRWSTRLLFVYTAMASLGLLLWQYSVSELRNEGLAVTLGKGVVVLSTLSGFFVAHRRAGRMAVRDGVARALLAPLPVVPRQLLEGKSKPIVVEALVTAAPSLLLFALPVSMDARIDIGWRVLAAFAAVGLASDAVASIAFLTQGVGSARGFGPGFGLETMLVATPLFAVAAAPYPWTCIVSLATLALVGAEARRSAKHCVRWVDDGDAFDRETPVWGALLVFAAFQATQAFAVRVVAFWTEHEGTQTAVGYAAASTALVALTIHGRRGQPPMKIMPESASSAALAIGAGMTTGALGIGYARLLLALGVTPPSAASDSRAVVLFAATVVLLAPLAEETFFRGWLQGAIADQLKPERRSFAPFVAAFAFAAVHPPLSFPPVFLLGVVTGIFYARTRAIGPGILAHAAHNGAVTIAILLAG